MGVFAGAIQNNDLADMEPKLLSMFINAGVPTDKIEELSKAGVKSSCLFGSMSADRSEMIEFIKAVCQYDVSARPLDMVPRGRVLTVWESCKTVNEVEKKFQAERSIQNLPPQVVQGDFEIAKAALEKLEGYELPKHWLPSKAYFERKLSHVETFFQAESLSTVTNISQADANEQQTLQFESSSGTFKIQKKEFGVAMPQTSEDLRTRLRVMVSCAVMVQMRYQSNPLLQSSSIDMFTRYTNFLFGPKGWMLVSLGPDKVPISCPTIHHVMGYDIGLREFVAKQMNNSVPIQKAFENALADGDLRSTHFTTAVNIDSQKPECRALTAPGITEAYPELLRRGVKRPREVIDESGAAASASAASPTSRTAGASKNARNRANKARQKAEETERANAKAAAAAAAIAAAPWGGDRARGRGAKGAKGAKGAGRGAKGGAKGAEGPAPALPEGIMRSTPAPENKSICYAWCQGRKCKSSPCSVAHACWWCGKYGHKPDNCPN